MRYKELKTMTNEDFRDCVIKCIKEEKTFPTINKLANCDYLYQKG